MRGAQNEKPRAGAQGFSGGRGKLGGLGKGKLRPSYAINAHRRQKFRCSIASNSRTPAATPAPP